MSITNYAPDAPLTAGNAQIMVLPTVKNLEAITVAEWNAGTSIECATRAFGTSADTDVKSDRYLCDTQSRETPGTTSYKVSDITLDVDPQNPAAVFDLLKKGAHVVLANREGVKHDTAATASQRYAAWRCTVNHNVPGELGTDEGQSAPRQRG